MVDVKDVVNLKEINIDFFCGVPDSQLSSFCDYIEEKENNIIALMKEMKLLWPQVFT